MSTPPPKLRGADLRQVPLADLSLAGADLRGADLRGVDLTRRILRDADLRGADLRGARLNGADLRDAELDGALLDGADLTDADLRRTRGQSVSGAGLRADGARFEGAEWRDARLTGAGLDGVRAPGWRLDRAELGGASLRGAGLERAVLDDGDLDGTDLGGARLRAAALAGVRGIPLVEDADLRSVDLRGVALEPWLGPQVQLAGARVSFAEALRHRERLALAGWTPNLLTRLSLAAHGGAALAQAGVRAMAARAAEERKAARDEQEDGPDTAEILPFPPAERPVEPPAPNNDRREELIARARAAGAALAAAGSWSRSIVRVVVGEPREDTSAPIEVEGDFHVDAATRDREIQRGSMSRDDRARLAVMHQRTGRARAEARARADAERKAEAARKAEAQHAAELARLAEAARIEEARVSEARRQAELAAQAQAAAAAEAARFAELARLAEDARRAEHARQAEFARLAEEARQAEVAREAELQRAAEEARRAEDARRAEERLRAEEAQRAEDARRAEEARRAEFERLAEETRRAEAARLAEESRAAEEARRREAERLAEEARRAEVRRIEEERLRAEAQRQADLLRREEAERREKEALAAAEREQRRRLAEERWHAENARLAAEAHAAEVARREEEARRLALVRAAEAARREDEARHAALERAHELAREQEAIRRAAELERALAERAAEQARHAAETAAADAARRAEQLRRETLEREAEAARAAEVARRVAEELAAEREREAAAQRMRLAEEDAAAARALEASRRVAGEAEADEARRVEEVRAERALPEARGAREWEATAGRLRSRRVDGPPARVAPRRDDLGADPEATTARTAVDARVEVPESRAGVRVDISAAAQNDAVIEAVDAADTVGIDLDFGSPDPETIAARAHGELRIIPAVSRATGARGVALAVFTLLAWVATRAGTVTWGWTTWLARVAWRVSSAGFLRGLPAAWRALADEATAGLDGVSLEESVEFRMDAATRERATLASGLRQTLDARRQVAAWRTATAHALATATSEDVGLAALGRARLAAARLREQENDRAMSEAASAAKALAQVERARRVEQRIASSRESGAAALRAERLLVHADARVARAADRLAAARAKGEAKGLADALRDSREAEDQRRKIEIELATERQRAARAESEARRAVARAEAVARRAAARLQARMRDAAARSDQAIDTLALRRELRARLAVAGIRHGEHTREEAALARVARAERLAQERAHLVPAEAVRPEERAQAAQAAQQLGQGARGARARLDAARVRRDAARTDRGATKREVGAREAQARIDAARAERARNNALAPEVSRARRQRSWVSRLLLRAAGFARGPEVQQLGPGAALAGARLDDRDLSRMDLGGADLHGASLVGANLRGARLAGADLRDADLTDAVLAGADLSGARLDGATLDQAFVGGARLDGASLNGARLVSTRGLAPGQRAALAARGADVGTEDDTRWSRVAGFGVVGSIAAVLALYLGARFAGEAMDSAALENAAAEAQQAGNAGEAAERFTALAAQTEDPTGRIDSLLEAAAAYEEAADPDSAMARLDEALALAKDTGAEARVRLRRAAASRRLGLAASAAAEYRDLLDNASLTPSEQAEALTGLALLDDDFDAPAEEDRLLAGTSTDVERGALALALADGWASVGRVSMARAVIERALALITHPDEVVPTRLRLARLLAEDGDTDGALALYVTLAREGGDLGGEARLGAAELYARRGNASEAWGLLEPMLEGDGDMAARARFAAAIIAEREGDATRTVALLQSLLTLPDLEPRLVDEARLVLARVLVKSDPSAAEALVAATPELREELLLGQARALREAGKRVDARAIWVQLAEDPTIGEEARIDAELSLAELQVEEGDAEGALLRYDRVMAGVASRQVRERIVLGKCNALVRTSKLQEAEVAYQALLATDPGPDVEGQALLGLARTAELRGQSALATSRYQEVGGREGPWAVEALDGLGQLRERAGDLAGAAQAWRIARGRASDNAERRVAIDISLARVLDAVGDPAAIELYDSLLEAPDPAVRVQARVAVAEGLVGSDPTRARALYQDAIDEAEAGEARSAARAGWLRASVALGEVEQGLARMRAWLDTETDSALRGELAVATVVALRAEGRPEDAVRVAEQWGKDGGFELAMERAGALREVGRPADAARVLAATEGGAAEDEVWRAETLADTYMEAGDFDAAATAFAALDDLPGGSAAATFGRARLARERGDFVEALKLLESSNDDRAPLERAAVLEGLGRFDDAETAWDRLALSPDLETRVAGVLGLARVRLSRDDAAGAITELDTLPVVPAAYMLTAAQVRGEALMVLRRYTDAAAVYRALDADAESRIVGALGLGEVALAQDDPAAAEAAFSRALSATQDDWYAGIAMAGMARAQAEAGELTRARVTLTRLRLEHPTRTDLLDAVQTVIGP